MEYLYIGKIVTTHNLDGEIKIRSNFKYKPKVFIPGFVFYVGQTKEKRILKTFRKQNEYDLFRLEGIEDIDTAIGYKNKLLYIKQEDLVLKKGQYLNEDYIGLMAIYNDKELGKIKEIIDSGNNNELFLLKEEKSIYIPKDKNFIKRIDLKNGKIYLKNLKGLV